MESARRSVSVAAGLLALSMAASACSNSPDSPAGGNIAPDDVARYDSVGFILDDGDYSFFAMPDASWTRIIGLHPDSDRALVWHRDDADSGYEAALLDLTQLEFDELSPSSLDGFFARGLAHDGQIVGGSDGASGIEGVVYDPESGDATLLAKPGSDFTGISAVKGDLVLGYTDAGVSTFLYIDDEFIDVKGDDVNRLLGNQVNADGVVVGYASFGDDPMWDPLNRGFVARPDGDRYTAEPFSLSGMLRTAITGINDQGQVAGHVHQDDDGPMTAYLAELDDPDGTLELYPLPDDVAALLSSPGTGASVGGMDDSGRVFGTIFITDPEPELWADEEICGGHGHLHGTECHCDDGYVQDPSEPGMCIIDSAG